MANIRPILCNSFLVLVVQNVSLRSKAECNDFELSTSYNLAGRSRKKVSIILVQLNFFLFLKHYLRSIYS